MKTLKSLGGLTFMLFAFSLNSQNAYVPVSVQNYNGTSLGINLGNAPSLFPLEVNGSMGFTFGNYLGIADGSTNLTHRKILEVKYDNTVGDYIALYTPGQAGTNGVNGQEKLRITMNGKFSFGAGTDPKAKIDVHESTPLGGQSGSSTLLSRLSGESGIAPTSNKFARNIWLTRFDNGTSWLTTNILDGISIDGLFDEPNNINDKPKTWWARDPNNDNQEWGNGNKSYLSLKEGKLLVSEFSSGINRARLQVEENVAFNGPTATKAFVVKTTHTADYAYGIVSDVNRDKTFALKVIHRDFNGIGLGHETFGVYGDGQTIISTKLPSDFSTTNGQREPAFLIQDATVTTPNANSIFFRVYKSGKTIIGDKTSWGNHNNAMLTVDGKIIGKEVVVTQLGWADFVFDNDYKLMPLNELESYYRNNHHLPQIPSTKEIIDNGNDLGKTDALLLQKIEELTLYVVEQDKKLKEQQAQIEKLKNSAK